MTEFQKKILKELALVWISVILLIRILSVLQETSSTILQLLGSLSAIVLIYPPVLLAMFQKKVIPYWHLDRKIFVQALKWFLFVCLVIFPAAAVVNHFYQSWLWERDYHTATTQIWASYAITQLLLVAFPEEFFFRGYLQGRLSEVFVVERKIFCADFGLPQILTALVFALSHSFIAVQWWHIFIFFPALVFAWLKEKTGTIWAGTMFHASCNMFAFWVAASYS